MSRLRYRIENAIGQGGMGTVYRAYDRLTGTWVALKQLKLELEEAVTPAVFTPTADAALRLALATEFRWLATLRHPHIVSVLDYGFGPEAVFFTMEFLAEAQPLVQVAQGLALAGQLQLLGQVLQTLEYLRRHQGVHRDLKPDNVLVQQGQVKVLDFGLAVLEGQQSPTAGSLLYMAPEGFRHEPLTHATDLFAVGVMAYEMLAGYHPFKANGLEELVARICTAAPDYARLRGPAALQAVIARLLAKDPAQRFATAAEALAALSAASGEPLTTETEIGRASFIQAAQFVGRQAELTQLTTALAQAQAGVGSVWLLGGESGVGKSRLLAELRVQALIRQAYVWPGQAVSEGGPPGQLWRTIWRWLALVAAPNDLEAGVLLPLVAHLEELLGRAIAPAPVLEAKVAQERLCATTLTLLRRAAAQQPIVLVLEDLHWADPLSMGVLQWVARSVGEWPVLVVGSYRSEEQPHLAQEIPQATPLWLARLTPAQVATLTSAILGQPEQAVGGLSQYLYGQTEGNAFFVVEVLRALADEAGWLHQVQHMALPARLAVGGIQQVIQRRLQRLAQADHAPLALAAVVGRRLDLRVLQQLAPTLDLAAWLARCTEAAVLEPLGAAWQFTHDQVRQGVLAALPAEQRVALHGTVALALEQVYAADLTPYYNDLAYHYGHAQQFDQQRHYLQRAGHAALALYAHAEAAACFTQALALTPAEAWATQYALYLAREQAYEAQGLRALQADDLQRLEILAERLADPACQTQVALRQCAYATLTSNYAQALAAARRTVALAQAQQDGVSHATALFYWGWVLCEQYRYAQAQHQLEIGLGLARAVQAVPIEIDILRQLGVALFRQGQQAPALASFEQGLALARARGDLRREGELLGILTLSGTVAEVIARTEQALRLAQTTGNRLWETINLINLGYRYLLVGQYALAQTVLGQAQRAAHEINSPVSVTNALYNLGETYFHLQDFAQAQACCETTLQLMRERNDQDGAGQALTTLGYVYANQARLTEAVALFQEAITIHQTLQQPLFLAESQAGLAWVWAQQGQLASALTIAAQVLACLATMPVDNAEDPMLLYWSLYQVLHLAHDPRAQTVLTQAVAWLRDKATQLTDPLRESFLHAVPWHRALLAAAHQLN